MNVEVSPFQETQAESLVQIFRAVHEDGYPLASVYERDFWIQGNANQELFTYVAQKGEQVLGAVSFYRSAPFSDLFEFGRLIVLPEHRKAGLGHQLLACALEQFSKETNASGVFGEMDCRWKVSQNMVHQLNFQDTALAVGFFKDQDQRFSAVLAYFDMRDRNHRVHLPPRWKDLLAFCYEDLGLRREFVHQGPPLTGSSRFQSGYAPRLQVAHLDCLEAGQDFAGALLEQQQRYPEAQIFQLRLNLEDERAIAAAESAYQQGYRCCGLLPRWFDGDGLLLQRNLVGPEWGHDQIASRRAQELARRIEFQWK
jgi:predicted GNAT family N-acyltransferase